MIPLKDDIPSIRFPAVNTALIAVNAAVFLFEMALGGARQPFILERGVVPARLLSAGIAGWSTILTSMFIHGGWAHLIGNMLYLFIFGDNVEDRLGRAKFVIFYLLCGIAATFAQLAFNTGSDIPNLGASGAIAGVLGAYILMFPRQQVRVLMGLRVAQVPALVVLGLWIVLQFFSGIGSITGAADTGGVAYMAHIGGFLAGIVLSLFMKGTSTR
jgi:membrane associated rhomboid family serine protease